MYTPQMRTSSRRSVPPSLAAIIPALVTVLLTFTACEEPVSPPSLPVSGDPSFAGKTVPDQDYTLRVPLGELTLPEASGGDGSLTYSLTPTVPGLAFNSSTRTLSGAPNVVNTYHMTYRAQDADGDDVSLTFAVTVSAPVFGLEFVPDDTYESMPVLDEPFSSEQYGSTLPSKVDLSNYAPPAGNQGTQSSCVGFAVAYLKNIQERMERNWSFSNPAHLMSPAFIYNQINGRMDGGANIGKALELVKDQGVSSLATMPYNYKDYYTWPSSTAITEAAAYKLHNYSRIRLNRKSQSNHPYFGIITRDDWLWVFKRHLVDKRPLVVGTLIYSDFYYFRKDSNRQPSVEKNPYYDKIDLDTGKGPGNHAILIVGYDDDQYGGAFKYLNSYGSKYGYDGYGWMTYKLAEQVIKSAYYAVDVVERPRRDVPPNTDPSFGVQTIGDQTYMEGTPISALRLPEAAGGNNPLVYDLTPTVPGLRFDPGTRQLTGTPTNAGTFNMMYMVSDVDGDTISLSFTITIRVAESVGDDHGNSRVTATRVTTGSTTHGVLTVGDVDYFRVTVSESGTLTAGTISAVDTYGIIEDARGKILAIDDDGGQINGDFIVLSSVNPGTYYVRVEGWDEYESGRYELAVGFVPSDHNGSVVFWTSADDGGGPINVFVEGQFVGTLTDFRSRVPSDCEASDDGSRVTVNLPPGEYQYLAEDNLGYWDGSIQIESGDCRKVELLGFGETVHIDPSEELTMSVVRSGESSSSEGGR